MAAIAITKRETSGHGHFKKEVGYFTDIAGGDYQIRTKLKSLIWFALRCPDVADTTGEIYINSASASAVEDDSGIVHVQSGMSSGSAYSYIAIGRG